MRESLDSVGDVLANEPIYYGLAASLVAYVVASLLTTRTTADVL
jgi:SSS family solute:Na+ symporter